MTEISPKEKISMDLRFRGMEIVVTCRTPQERVGTSSIIHDDQIELLDRIDDENVDKVSCLWDIR